MDSREAVTPDFLKISKLMALFGPLEFNNKYPELQSLLKEFVMKNPDAVTMTDNIEDLKSVNDEKMLMLICVIKNLTPGDIDGIIKLAASARNFQMLELRGSITDPVCVTRLAKACEEQLLPASCCIKLPCEIAPQDFKSFLEGCWSSQTERVDELDFGMHSLSAECINDLSDFIRTESPAGVFSLNLLGSRFSDGDVIDNFCDALVRCKTSKYFCLDFGNALDNESISESGLIKLSESMIANTAVVSLKIHTSKPLETYSEHVQQAIKTINLCNTRNQLIMQYPEHADYIKNICEQCGKYKRSMTAPRVRGVSPLSTLAGGALFASSDVVLPVEVIALKGELDNIRAKLGVTAPQKK